MTEEPQRPRRPMGGPMGRHGGAPVEKAKDFKGTFSKLITYSRSYLPMVIVAMIAAVGGAVFQILGPDRIKDLTNEISNVVKQGVLTSTNPPIDMGVITSIAFVLICLYVGAFILMMVQGWIMATATQKIAKQMRSDISKKINRLPFSYFNKASYGDVLSRVTNDVDTIGLTLNQSVAAIATAAAMFAGSLIMMFYTNWIMAITAMGASLFGFAMIIIIMKRSQKFFNAQQKDLGNVNGHVEETYTGHNIVKVYNGSKEFKKQFEEINGRLYNSGWKSQFLSGLMMPLMLFIGNFGYAAVCLVGAMLVMNGTISFGVIVAFMLYVRLFTQPLSQFAQAFNNLQRTAAASERVFEFLEEKELEDESQKVKRLTDVKGDIEFRNVHFGYTEEKIVINDFSAHVKAGQKIAIVGPTGAGKTTMVNLLMRFYELNEGSILLDGIPMNEVRREDVHEQFCMVLQDTWLFEGTIKENIIYSKQNVSDEEVMNACKMVGLDHFIRTLPDGYDTVLNDRASLSEGQKQLLTIARAIIKDSPLLILDEATSSVDTRTERIVQEAMDMLTKGRTSFIIAHRLSTIKNADIIIVMKEGDIIESGNHNELLEKKGAYAELYNSQFETA
ncbi:MAG: ABC transporter ATP-binding protein/permease [Methanomassiliicoccaceae archaeon]|nr:ABC transporter ATP-binding protein/permease [Methanomassiliicoccaceae archaeon]